MDNKEKLIIPDFKHVHFVFTPDDALAACRDELLNEDHCRRWIIKKLHPETLVCPFCKSPVREHQNSALQDGKRIYCRECSRGFTAFSETCLSGMKWSCRDFILLLFLIATGRNTKQIADILGRSWTAVNEWRNRIAGPSKYARRNRRWTIRT